MGHGCIAHYAPGSALAAWRWCQIPAAQGCRHYTTHVQNPTGRVIRQVSVRSLSLEQAGVETYRVAGTPAERIAMVWPLTLEVLALSGDIDTRSRLQRSVVSVRVLGD